jgi:hypothetical protein
MLKPIQAAEIVQNSIRELTSESSPAGRGARATERSARAVDRHTKLAHIGVDRGNLGGLLESIAADPTRGVIRYEHYLDPSLLSHVSPEITIGDLSDLVVRLAVGKMCSNPHNPHPQTCCPYPAKCPQCGYSVI